MNHRFTRCLALLGALMVLVIVNGAIVGKERLRQHGLVAYLALEPVDPRSLLQGDYMALRFSLVRQLEAQLDPEARSETRAGASGAVSVKLDARRVAWIDSADTGVTAPGAATRLRLKYRVRDGRVWLGTDAFFFPEGSADRYAKARFGEFRVDPVSGEAMLVGLVGADLAPL